MPGHASDRAGRVLGRGPAAQLGRLFEVEVAGGCVHLPLEFARDVHRAGNIRWEWAFGIGVDAVTDEQHEVRSTRQHGLDDMEVQIEVTPEVFSDKIGALEDLQGRLMHALEHVLGIRAQVRLVEPRSIQRSEGKAKRLIDRRNLAE